MTKNKLVIDPHGRNHFKFMPADLEGWPENEGEQLKKIERIYKDLVENGEIIFTASKKGAYSIKCVELKLYYIVVCIKNEFKTFNNIIYEIKSKNDALAISKFVAKNIKTTMADYKTQILDANKMHVIRKEGQDEEGRNTSESDNQ